MQRKGNARMTKQYTFNGLSGCVIQRKSRESGSLVGLYHAAQAEIAACEPWITVCELHGCMVVHATLALAIKDLPTPSSWCGVCRGDESEGAIEL